WKLNGAKYPTSQQIARNFLAIPITSIASESAFRSYKRLLDPHMSRLHYSIVEAMMCTLSWIKNELKRESDIDISVLEGVFSAMTMEDSVVEEQNNSGKAISLISFCLNLLSSYSKNLSIKHFDVMFRKPAKLPEDKTPFSLEG
ncbi:Putative AC transposase, partial [Linum grandiflorum]